MNKTWGKVLGAVVACLALVGGPAAASDAEREVTLSASAQTSVAQDWLRMRFAAKGDGADASALQARLKRRLQQAIDVVQPMAAGEALRVETGGFQLSPRYNSAGAPMGWRGSAELILSGRDFGRIGEASGKLGDLAVVSVDLSVSDSLARQTREAVRLEAIAAFRTQASSVAQAFGYSAYDLLDVNVGSDSPGGRVPMMMRAMAADAAPVPVVAGQEDISVQVSGRIRLR